MNLQMLISSVNQDVRQLAENMNLEADALIINQCDTFGYEEYDYKGNRIRAYSMKERGVGLSRNTALMRADRELCLFSDEDIVYDRGYAEAVRQEFERLRDADLLLFNVRVSPSRRTYWNETEARVRWHNYGRYPAYSIAVRRESLLRAGVTFSLLFGGGARYSNGEDSLFLKDCLKKGLRIYRVKTVIGEERERPSTWFSGYHETFFMDRGVLYHFLYGRLAVPMALRFLLAHKDEMCREMGFSKAYHLMKKGIRSVL